MMDDRHSKPQLQMFYPQTLYASMPKVQISTDYFLRTYKPEDDSQFFDLMELAGWTGWNEEILKPWHKRVLPNGWFMMIHKYSAKFVASCMALRSDVYPHGGELGWLAGNPNHAGRGLGFTVSAAVTACFIEDGCSHIHLYTEDYRLPALKIYMELGYLPVFDSPEVKQRWERIYSELSTPFP